MSYPYCLPIIKPNANEIESIIRAQNSEFQYFEVWLDYIDNLEVEFVQQLAEELKDRLIVALRRQKLEPIKMRIEKRLRILDALAKNDVKIDLDITQQEELDHFNKNRGKATLIISYHNYKNTPEKSSLRQLVQQINEYKPTIIKIATMCQNEQDSLKLLNLLLSLKTDGQKYIILGMGDYGLITRIFGALWGNELIFAPNDLSEASAPGQLTKKQMDNLLGVIGE